MSDYDKVKKVKRIAAVVYFLIMAVVIGGTYLSEQNKKQSMKVAEKELEDLLMPMKNRRFFRIPGPGINRSSFCIPCHLLEIQQWHKLNRSTGYYNNYKSHIIERRFIMHTFEQVKDVIHYSKMIHARLRKFYGSLNEKSQPERVKILLDYLIEDQRHREETLSSFEAVSQQSILDTWRGFAHFL
jgi:hypothetical protein